MSQYGPSLVILQNQIHEVCCSAFEREVLLDAVFNYPVFN